MMATMSKVFFDMENCTIFQWTLTSILTCISGAIDDIKANQIHFIRKVFILLLVFSNILYYILRRLQLSARFDAEKRTLACSRALLPTQHRREYNTNKIYGWTYETVHHFFLIIKEFMFFSFFFLRFLHPDAINKEPRRVTINKRNYFSQHIIKGSDWMTRNYKLIRKCDAMQSQRKCN